MRRKDLWAPDKNGDMPPFPFPPLDGEDLIEFWLRFIKSDVPRKTRDGRYVHVEDVFDWLNFSETEVAVLDAGLSSCGAGVAATEEEIHAAEDLVIQQMKASFPSAEIDLMRALDDATAAARPSVDPAVVADRERFAEELRIERESRK